jgi:hypothetical protein
VDRAVSAPENITLDGYPGKKMVVRVADDVIFGTCDDRGLFDSRGLLEPTARQVAYSQGRGGIEEVWAVDVDGTLVVLFAGYNADTAPRIVDELHSVMASVTFEMPQP